MAISVSPSTDGVDETEMPSSLWNAPIYQIAFSDVVSFYAAELTQISQMTFALARDARAIRPLAGIADGKELTAWKRDESSRDTSNSARVGSSFNVEPSGLVFLSPPRLPLGISFKSSHIRRSHHCLMQQRDAMWLILPRLSAKQVLYWFILNDFLDKPRSEFVPIRSVLRGSLGVKCIYYQSYDFARSFDSGLHWHIS